MSKEDLQNKFNFVVDQMEYNSLVSAIPDGWRQMIKNQYIPLKDNEILVITRALHGTKTFVKIIKKFCTEHIRC